MKGKVLKGFEIGIVPLSRSDMGLGHREWGLEDHGLGGQAWELPGT